MLAPQPEGATLDQAVGLCRVVAAMYDEGTRRTAVITFEGKEWVDRAEARALTGKSFNTIRHWGGSGKVRTHTATDKNVEKVYLLLDDLRPEIEAYEVQKASEAARPAPEAEAGERLTLLEGEVELLRELLAEARDQQRELLALLMELVRGDRRGEEETTGVTPAPAD